MSDVQCCSDAWPQMPDHLITIHKPCLTSLEVLLVAKDTKQARRGYSLRCTWQCTSDRSALMHSSGYTNKKFCHAWQNFGSFTRFQPTSDAVAWCGQKSPTSGCPCSSSLSRRVLLRWVAWDPQEGRQRKTSAQAHAQAQIRDGESSCRCAEAWSSALPT